jgi:MoaA/NifB/PqqE/SkfB family radical SAM enzyme
MIGFENRVTSFEMIPHSEWFDYDLKVTLKPTFKCNHKCWFCTEYDNSTKSWTKEQCDLVLQKLKDIPQSKKRIFFYFYGGEPTLSKHWEYLNYRLVEIFKDRELFIQTQTNLSLKAERLERFLQRINTIKSDSHKIDICSSYHLNKQRVNEFVEKMHICDRYNSLGFCFFSTELLHKEQTLREIQSIIDAYPSKLKMRFTEIYNLQYRNIPEYAEYLTDSYLLGDDHGKSLEFRYWLKYYPELRQYFEKAWDFKVNDQIFNFSEVSAYNIHMKFKFMKCECGVKNMVIDHNLKVYHCNDDFYNNRNITNLSDLNLECYLNKSVRCLNNACYDGLDHKKIL